jgi:hypothetical protein
MSDGDPSYIGALKRHIKSFPHQNVHRFYDKMMTDEFHSYLRENMHRIQFILKNVKCRTLALDDESKITVVKELLIRKRRMHARLADENYHKFPDIPMDSFTLDDAKSYMLRGQNPFENRFIQLGVVLRRKMEAKKKERYYTMKVLSLLDPEEITEVLSNIYLQNTCFNFSFFFFFFFFFFFIIQALLACIDLSESKKKKTRSSINATRSSYNKDLAEIARNA